MQRGNEKLQTAATDCSRLNVSVSDRQWGTESVTALFLTHARIFQNLSVLVLFLEAYTSQSWKILPNCRRKQNTNNKKWSFVWWLKNKKCSIIMKHWIILRKNPIDTWNIATSTWKIEANQMQFLEPHQKCQHFQQRFFNNMGENVQRRETEASEQWIWWAGWAWENTFTDHEKVLVVESPTRTCGKCNISYIETQEHYVHWAWSSTYQRKSNGYHPIHYINYQYIDSHKGISEPVEALYYNTNP